jgi:hypothetical protein
MRKLLHQTNIFLIKISTCQQETLKGGGNKGKTFSPTPNNRLKQQ